MNLTTHESWKLRGNFIKTKRFRIIVKVFFLFLVASKTFSKIVFGNAFFFTYPVHDETLASRTRCIQLWLTKRTAENLGWHLLDGFASAMSNSFQSPGICGLLLNPIRSNMFTMVRIRAKSSFWSVSRYITKLLFHGQRIVVPKYLNCP